MKKTQKLTAKAAFTLAESSQKRHVIAHLMRDLPPLGIDTTSRGEIAQGGFVYECNSVSERRSEDRRSRTSDSLERKQIQDHYTVPLRNDMNSARKCAFTLAETLIALAVIGIVAALTIPGIVKNYNQKAWERAQTVFSRKLDVALKEMNTDGTLTGYRTTEDFVNELKKNIKITKVCTGSQITNCFADKVVWNEGEDPIEITTSSVKFTEKEGLDWAEPVGIQFVNGVNAIIGYNKNCYSDPYNNQYSPSSTCIGIMYDVSGYKKPNARDKDIATNGNVALRGCAFKATYGGESVCFTRVWAPGEYVSLTMKQCKAQQETLGIDYCYLDNDSFAGAAAACGGKKKMANEHQLELLAKYLYGQDSLSDTQGSMQIKTNLLGPFKSYYETHTGHPDNTTIEYENVFYVYGGHESYSWDAGVLAYLRIFYTTYTLAAHNYYNRVNTTRFALCVE